MTDKTTQGHAGESNMEKDPDQWVTGEEPMTGAQRSYLKTLSEEAKVPFDDRLTKAEASKRIDELQANPGRGKPQKNDTKPSGHITTDPTGNPGSPGRQQSRPKGPRSSA
jgi:hypothetical protein